MRHGSIFLALFFLLVPQASAAIIEKTEKSKIATTDSKAADYIPNNSKVPSVVDKIFNEVFGKKINVTESEYWKERARRDKVTESKLRGAMLFQKAKGLTMPKSLVTPKTTTLSKNKADTNEVLRKLYLLSYLTNLYGKHYPTSIGKTSSYSGSTYLFPSPTPNSGISILGRGNGSCNKIGSTTFCSDGTSYNQIGNTVFGSNGSSYNKIGNTIFGSDGTSYNKIGNTTFASDGTSYNQIGNTIFGSDGSSYQTIGNTIFANSGY